MMQKTHSRRQQRLITRWYYYTAEVMLCFLLLAFHLHCLFSQQNMGVQCNPWECGIGEEGCVLPRRVGDETPWCVTHTLSCWLLSSPLFTLAVFQSGGLGNYLFPDTNGCSFQILYSLPGWELFCLFPRNPEPKVYRKDWAFQKLPLSEHRWYQNLDSLQQNPYFLFPPPSHLIFLQAFSWFTSPSSPTSCLPPHLPVIVFLDPFFLPLITSFYI